MSDELQQPAPTIEPIPTEEVIRSLVADEIDRQTEEIIGQLESDVSYLGQQITNGNETVSKSITSQLETNGDSSTVTTMVLDDSQWAVLREHGLKLEETALLANASILFSMLLLAVIVGMRFYSEFSRGFRR